MESKKGLSQVVTTVILIGLVIAAIVIVWTFVDSIVTKNLDKTSSCYNLFEKIELNEEYTCYNSTGKYMQISLERKELELTSLLIAINFETDSQIFSLTNTGVNLENVKNYPSNSSIVQLPGNEAGKTYYFYGIDEKPAKVEISPNLGGTQCEVIDKIETVLECRS